MKSPHSPAEDRYRKGLVASIDCDSKATPMEKTVANDTLHRFCEEHLGVNIGRGDNFSTYYDASDVRLYFNVINQCAPNGVYLPFDTCVTGFSAVSNCPADCGLGFTSGGQASKDCLAFGLEAEAGVPAVVAGSQGDGIVVTCEGSEGLCESK